MEEKVDYKKIIEKTKEEFNSALNLLKESLLKIRVARASPEIFQDIKVEIFGKKYLLKQLATISLSQSREILIQPWDSSYIEGILKSIEKAEIGASIIVEGNSIKISLPPLTEDFREKMIKLVSQKKEKAKKTIREAREKALSQIQQAFREGKISEDEKFKGKKELQKVVEEFNEKIEEIVEKKIAEIKS